MRLRAILYHIRREWYKPKQAPWIIEHFPKTRKATAETATASAAASQDAQSEAAGDVTAEFVCSQASQADDEAELLEIDTIAIDQSDPDDDIPAGQDTVLAPYMPEPDNETAPTTRHWQQPDFVDKLKVDISMSQDSEVAVVSSGHWIYGKDPLKCQPCCPTCSR